MASESSSSFTSRAAQLPNPADVPRLVASLAGGGRDPQALRAVTALASRACGTQSDKDQVIAGGGMLSLSRLLSDPDTPLLVVAAAARAVAALAVDRQARKDAVVASGVLPSLVRIFQSNKNSTDEAGVEARRASARAVAGIACGGASSRCAAFHAGGMSLILTILRLPTDSEDADVTLKLQATSAVSQLCRGAEATREEVLSHGVIPVLVNIISSHRTLEDIGAEILDVATELIAFLSSTNTQTKAAIVSADAVPVLADLLQQPDIEWTVTESAVEAIAELAADGNLGDALLSARVVPALLVHLRSNDEILKEKVVVALCNLAMGGPAAEQAVLSSGAIQEMLALMSAGREEVNLAEAAGYGIAVISDLSEDSRAVLTDAGVMQVLAAILGQGGYSRRLQELAAEAINLLSAGSSVRQAAAIQAGALPSLLQVVASSERLDGAAQHAILAICGLCACSDVDTSELSSTALPTLTKVLQEAGLSSATKQAVIQMLAKLARRGLASGCAVAASGIVPVLVELLHHPSEADSCALAAHALATVASRSKAGQDQVFAAGALPAVLMLLSSEHEVHAPHRCQAARVLYSLAEGRSEEIRLALLDCKAIPMLLYLVSSGQPNVLKYVAGSLALLVEPGPHQCRACYALSSDGAGGAIMYRLSRWWSQSPIDVCPVTLSYLLHVLEHLPPQELSTSNVLHDLMGVLCTWLLQKNQPTYSQQFLACLGQLLKCCYTLIAPHPSLTEALCHRLLASGAACTIWPILHGPPSVLGDDALWLQRSLDYLLAKPEGVNTRDPTKHRLLMTGLALMACTVGACLPAHEDCLLLQAAKTLLAHHGGAKLVAKAMLRNDQLGQLACAWGSSFYCTHSSVHQRQCHLASWPGSDGRTGNKMQRLLHEDFNKDVIGSICFVVGGREFFACTHVVKASSRTLNAALQDLRRADCARRMPLPCPASIPPEKLYSLFSSCMEHAYFGHVKGLGFGGTVEPAELLECARWLQMPDAEEYVLQKMSSAVANARDETEATWMLTSVLGSLGNMDRDVAAQLIQACGPAVMKWAESSTESLRQGLEKESQYVRALWSTSLADALLSFSG